MPSRGVFTLFILLELFIAAVCLLLYGFTLEALQTITRYSGRLSLVVFSFIFLVKHKPNSKNFISDNPYLLFAVVHGIHLAELLTYVYLNQSVLIPVRLLGGFVAYLMIFAMPVIVHYRQSQKISQQQFSKIETVFQYYVWFIFFMSYLPRVMGTLPGVGGSPWENITLMTWVVLMLLIKLSQYVKVGAARQA